MKIFLLDVYSNRNYRVSKDTNGGLGTGNDFGNSLFPTALKFIKKQTTDFPPLYMAYIAGALTARGHEVEYGRNMMPPDDVDMVIMSTSVVEHTTELEWGRLIKAAGYNLGFVGPFAGIVKDEYLKVSDFVVIGEPEMFFCAKFSGDKLKGAILSDETVPLDDLPMPDWSPFPIKSLKYKLFGGGGVFLPMQASRGCPYPCRYYCAYPLQQGKIMRYRSAKNIVDEMLTLKRKYNVRTILFRDPVFSLDRTHTLEFLDELKRRNVNMRFVIETHLNTLDDELIERFYESGLVTIKVGVEAPNNEILKKNKRRPLKKDVQRNIINKLESLGINVISFYMLGFPQDTWDTCMDTIRYALRINSIGAQFTIVTPYPGTEFYKDVCDDIFAEKYDDFTLFHLVYRHRNLTYDQVEKLKNIAYTKYYLRISWLLKYSKRYLVKFL